jgi:uncharacterized protein YbcI
VRDEQRFTGGELNAALTEALVGTHMKHLERAPAKASTFHNGNVVVTLMDDLLTNAEKILAREGKLRDVSEVRDLIWEQIEPDLRGAVERLTGRSVIALLSGHHIEPDITATLFFLDAPL